LDREFHEKYGPTSEVVSALHPSSVGVYGLPDHGKPQASATALGGEIGFPDVVQVLGWKPWPRVLDLYFDQVSVEPGPNLDLPPVPSCVDGVQKEVPERPEEGIVMTNDRRKAFGGLKA
jgi:hypothetical protein